MTGDLSAREIANMSGDIWNHVPQMIHHFKEEGIAFPVFSDEEMADLIAYLHGGAPAGMGTSPSTGAETGMEWRPARRRRVGCQNSGPTSRMAYLQQEPNFRTPHAAARIGNVGWVVDASEHFGPLTYEKR
jgi:hypothetical protein